MDCAIWTWNQTSVIGFVQGWARCSGVSPPAFSEKRRQVSCQQNRFFELLSDMRWHELEFAFVWKQKYPQIHPTHHCCPLSYFQTRLDPKIGDSTSAKYHGQQWWENHVFSEPNPIKSVPVVSNWRLERRVLAALAPCRTWTSCRRSSFRRKPRSENQLDRQL